MARHIPTKLLVAGLIAVTSCSPVSSGPELPRPAQKMEGTVPTSLATTTTTSPDARARAMTECPGAFCVIYRIAAGARWSDGARVRASDFVHTFEVMADPANGGRVGGYDLISAVEVFDSRTVRVVFRQKFGAWQTLFGRLVPPGQEWADLLSSPTTGPFHVTEIVPHERVVIRRTEDWWGEGRARENAPDVVREVTFVFIDDPAEMITALADGTVDLITARADPDLVEGLRNLPDVHVDVTPGPFWEHIDFHHDDALLSEKWVRRVIDLAIDRQKILDRTVRTIEPDAPGLGNTVWLGTTFGYEQHYIDRHGPEVAERILVEQGCTREDDVYTCGGRAMSFVWASTNDDPMRRAVFDSAQEDLAVVGIELTERFRSPSNFVTREFLFGGPEVWQLVNFSWRGLSDPGESAASYMCEDPDLNVNRYCSETVEELVLSADMELDPARRTALLNEADERYLADLAVIPLYQKPNVMAWTRSLDGPVPNYSTSGDLWNIETWTGKESIVVALAAGPLELSPLAGDDPNTNTVLGPLLYGAFGMDPSLRPSPRLLESVDIVEG